MKAEPSWLIPWKLAANLELLFEVSMLMLEQLENIKMQIEW